MEHGSTSGHRWPQGDIQAALAAMGVDELREVIRDVMRELDDLAWERAATAIVNRAARGGSGWVPAALEEADVAAAIAFAEAAKSLAHAHPEDVDDHLRLGTAAFLRQEYAVAQRIFGALLPPLASGEIDLGQHEGVDEVLSVSASECAVQYAASVYMTADPARRAPLVRAAIREVSAIGYLAEPIQEMERVATDLPGLAQFLPEWRAILEREAGVTRHGSADGDVARWLREAVRRMEGPAGLAGVARSTKHVDDLLAWCEGLMDAGDWAAVMAACEEAADLLTDRDREAVLGWFLDGAALAAHALGIGDVSPWLERAWCGQPTMPRLLRWLGCQRAEDVFEQRVTQALQACPQWAQRQRAFLHLLHGDVERACQLLTEAAGLGWSNAEHPGPLIFPLFQALLSGKVRIPQVLGLADVGADSGELEWPISIDDAEPRLATPQVEDLLRAAGLADRLEARWRPMVLSAMRSVAEKRLAAVSEQKRRRSYGHAASLVASCVACDESPEVRRWAGALRERYRRFPALRTEFDRRIGSG